MEQILKEHEKLERKANLKKGIDDVQRIIDQLKAARNTVSADPNNASMTLAKLQTPIKQSLERVQDDLKDIHNGLNKYSKALKDKFKDRPLPFAESNPLSDHPSLINRAIAMHLLREGHFSVAQTFISEANANPPPESLPDPAVHIINRYHQPTWEADFSPTSPASATLQRQFAQMYRILHHLRSPVADLGPAIDWARENSTRLESRGSNLEYDLCRLQYISLFTSHPTQGPLSAVAYARATFPAFPPRYAAQTHALLGALAYTPSLGTSPYAHLFHPSTSSTAAAATAFTTDFCALLSLPSASPLLTATTAGCIALPTLLKLSQIQQQYRTSWTTASELPVEVPLPPAYAFHSIFVCPVSKEQSTDANPPMMMPCGHVVARESLDKLSKGGKFKCPYCPAESHPKDAVMVFL